jgi:hypothetical protein
MTKNPIVNALIAALYIGIVASVMYYGQPLVDPVDNVLMPITMLSLVSLSAAVMAYTFFYQPVLMYLEGQKTDAVKLGFRTLGAFAAITAVFLVLLFVSPMFYL